MSGLRPCWLLGVLAALAGCASWDVPQEPLDLPLPQMVPDSVVFEIAYVKIPPDEERLVAEIWREVDEQQLPGDVRRRLADNGLRTGVLGDPLPTPLRNWLQAQESLLDDEGLANGTLDEDVVAPRKRMQCRTGRPGKVVTRSEPQGLISILTSLDGRVAGESFDKPQCLFVLKAFPESDGRVRLELLPEVEFGEPRPRYVGRTGVWSIDASREKRSYEPLKISSSMRPGQTVIVGCAADRKGVGEQFFTTAVDGHGRQTLLLIRLQQTQVDHRFEELKTE